jgi:MFS family permease
VNDKNQKISAAAATSVGLLALASAMGIGRFSLTPILPLMQQDAGLSLTVAGWMATANYLGYLLGALVCIALTPRPAFGIRWGLIGVAVTTLFMGFADWPPLWLALRFLGGIASSFVLVGTSAWAIPILRDHGKEEWSGHVFSGVGIGIAFAGLFGLAAAVDAWSSRLTWIVLGLVACVLAMLLWRSLGSERAPLTQADNVHVRALPRPAIIAAICYGAFGFGYIIPATFLPSLAKGYVDDPATFGLIWPIFGAAAALSDLRQRPARSDSGAAAVMDTCEVGAHLRRPRSGIVDQRANAFAFGVVRRRHLYDHHHGWHQGRATPRRRAGAARGRRDDGCLRRGPDRRPIDGEPSGPFGPRVRSRQYGRCILSCRRQLGVAVFWRCDETSG